MPLPQLPHPPGASGGRRPAAAAAAAATPASGAAPPPSRPAAAARLAGWACRVRRAGLTAACLACVHRAQHRLWPQAHLALHFPDEALRRQQARRRWARRRKVRRWAGGREVGSNRRDVKVDIMEMS
eukprot:363756-Chlamydomonas_euryale.AAC.12